MVYGRMFRFLMGASICLCAVSAHADATEKLRQFLDKTASLSSTFSLSVWSESRREATRSEGRLVLQKPGKFRWEVDHPYPQLILGDGEKVWIYDPDLAQVSIRKIGDALGGSPVALLSGTEAEIRKHFTLREAEKKDGLEWIEAIPKTQDSGISRALVGFTGKGLPKTMRIFDNFGQITTIRFYDVKRNPSIPAKQFQFTLPEGVEVLEE